MSRLAKVQNIMVLSLLELYNVQQNFAASMYQLQRGKKECGAQNCQVVVEIVNLKIES